ncbi:ABC transporter permease [Gemmatimonadota bacterium]
MHLIIQFFRELSKEKTRMFLTVMALAWGAANTVLLLSVGEGLSRQFLKGWRGLGENVMVVSARRTTKAFAGFQPGRRIYLTEDDISLLKEQVPEIAEVSTEYERNLEIRYGDKVIRKRLMGVHPVYGSMRNIIPETGGRFINDLDQQRRRRVIVLGNEVRDELLGKGEPAVGAIVVVNNLPFTVVGVMNKKIQNACYSGMDKSHTWIPASTYRAMFNPKYSNRLIFQPETAALAEASVKGFYRFMASKYHFDPSDEETFGIWNTVKMVEINGNIFLGIEIFLGIIGALTLLVAGIGVANIMYVIVRERTREIGIKVAVGARPAVIIGQFVLESLLTVAIGGAIGMALAASLVKGINLLPIEHEVMDLVGHPFFSRLLALICISFLGFIGLLAGIFPARRASSVDPVEALRYE